MNDDEHAPAVAASSIPGIKPPAPLVVDKTIREEWRRWKRQWDDYCIIQSVRNRPTDFQASLFRMSIGSEAVKVLDTQPAPLNADGSAKDVTLMSTLMEMMETFVMGQVNPTYERYLLRKRVQQPGENFEAFLTDLKTMIKICAVPDNFADELVKDQIIFGITDNALRERLLQERVLTLLKCTKMCKASEAASSHLKAMASSKTDASVEVASVKNRTKGPASDKYPRDNQQQSECKYCGLYHPMLKSRCPAVGQKCSSCGEEHHYARKCPHAKSTGPKIKQRRKVRYVGHKKHYTSSDSESIGMIGTIHGKEMHLNLKYKVGQ